ncbi:transporter substrate-binding domain-containing protein [Kushneria aurantia]|uniref:Transporter substrate-binding domain-containing protein n=1 Tax=Kushneria aurantia TaxID=504092 RepID=A0ABV6G2I3_9GAMM|nr:transporter substrate-binding domain-containing protein [Kushneria aurantia]
MTSLLHSARRLLVAALSTTLLAAAMVAPAAAADLATIQERGTLRVAVPQDFPPFGSVGTDLQPQGYDIDTAHYLADSMQLDLELVPVTSANRIPFLTTDKVDLVISSLGKNPERAQAIDFSDKYAPFFFGVFRDAKASDQDSIDSLAELSGHTVGVTRGALEDIRLSEVAPEGTTIRRFEDNATTISAFLSGQVELIATGNPVAAQIASRDASREPVLAVKLEDSPCYIGLAKGNPELMARVNELIAQGMADGTFEALSEKWFHAPLPDGFAAGEQG